jgi:hypothetical protein
VVIRVKITIKIGIT